MIVAVATFLGALCNAAISAAGVAAQFHNVYGINDVLLSVRLHAAELIGEGYYRSLLISAATWWGPLYFLNAALIIAITWLMVRVAGSRILVFARRQQRADWKLRAVVICPECGTTNGGEASSGVGTTQLSGLRARVLLICLGLALLAGLGTAWFWELYFDSSAGFAGVLYAWWGAIVWSLLGNESGLGPSFLHSPRYWIWQGLASHLPFMLLHGVLLSGALWLVGAFRWAGRSALECQRCGYDLRGHVVGGAGASGSVMG